jgi:hypothetical protein
MNYLQVVQVIVRTPLVDTANVMPFTMALPMVAMVNAGASDLMWHSPNSLDTFQSATNFPPLGLDVQLSTPVELAARLRRDPVVWKGMVRKVGFTPHS